MIIKRLLILLPLAVIVLLLQSYFWVPTFSDQVKGSKRRLTQYISGSIGDAQILNPILHSDTTSGGIVDLVFNGLIDRDKNLKFRGRLAFSWRLVMAPLEVLEYVAAHECAHLLEMNHSNRFWAHVARCRPSWKRERAWLRRHGASLHAVSV